MTDSTVLDAFHLEEDMAPSLLSNEFYRSLSLSVHRLGSNRRQTEDGPEKPQARNLCRSSALLGVRQPAEPGDVNRWPRRPEPEML